MVTGSPAMISNRSRKSLRWKGSKRASAERRIDAFELEAGLTYLDNEPLENVVSKPIYQESLVLLTRADSELGKRSSLTWVEAASLKLCLLTADMQNRRIIDGVFRSVGCTPIPAIETNSIFNLCSHVAIEGISSIVSRQLLEFFGLPRGARALSLVEPDVKRTIGLIVADRHPMPPLARNFLEMAQPIDEALLSLTSA